MAPKGHAMWADGVTVSDCVDQWATVSWRLAARDCAVQEGSHVNKLTGLLASALAVTLLLLTAGPSAAATRTIRDPRGDAPARYDFTTVTYGNDARVAATAKVVDLRRVRSIFVVKMFRPGHPDATYQAHTRLRRDGLVTASLHYYDTRVFKRVECTVRGSWRPVRDVVKVSFPQSCLRWHGTLKMYAFLGRPAAGGEVDRADSTRLARVPLG